MPSPLFLATLMGLAHTSLADLIPEGPSYRDAALAKRAECGPGIGSCPPGGCCSEAGTCGTGFPYCDGSSCQLDFSDSCDTFTVPSGGTTEDIRRPEVGNVPYGVTITECTTPGMMALTFDDGPFIHTNRLLDILDDYGVKATFFVSGNNKGKGQIDEPGNGWDRVLRRMHDAGHHIGSHTWSHRDLNQVNSTIQRTEIIHNEMAFRNILGWFPGYLRAPFLGCDGSCASLITSLGYHLISVNIDTKDYMYNHPDLIQQAKDRFSAGLSGHPDTHSYITLAHEVHEQTVESLAEYMIEASLERGFQLVTVGECLGDPEENWYRDAI